MTEQRAGINDKPWWELLIDRDMTKDQMQEKTSISRFSPNVTIKEVMIINDRICNILETFPFWSKLTSSEKDTLVQSARIEMYNKGEHISHTYEKCKGPILVVSGRIRTYILSDEGREVTLYHLYRGDVCALSASCLLKSIVFDVVIEATEKTEVIVVPAAVFHALQEKNPELEIFLLRVANERFSDVMWTMQQILFMGADKRVAIYLWDEYTKTGERILTITHDELARYIGSAREVVTRVLKYFAEEDIVTLSRGKIEIVDLEKLRDLV